MYNLREHASRVKGRAPGRITDAVGRFATAFTVTFHGPESVSRVVVVRQGLALGPIRTLPNSVQFEPSQTHTPQSHIPTPYRT